MNLSTKPDFVSGPETTASRSILVRAGLQITTYGLLDNEPYSVLSCASGSLNLLMFWMSLMISCCTKHVRSAQQYLTTSAMALRTSEGRAFVIATRTVLPASAVAKCPLCSSLLVSDDWQLLERVAPRTHED